MQWPLTSQSHGIVSQREQLFFCYGSNSTIKVVLLPVQEKMLISYRVHFVAIDRGKIVGSNTAGLLLLIQNTIIF
jgi:hypothetical protein